MAKMFTLTKVVSVECDDPYYGWFTSTEIIAVGGLNPLIAKAWELLIADLNKSEVDYSSILSKAEDAEEYTLTNPLMVEYGGREECYRIAPVEYLS